MEILPCFLKKWIFATNKKIISENIFSQTSLPKIETCARNRDQIETIFSKKSLLETKLLNRDQVLVTGFL